MQPSFGQLYIAFGATSCLSRVSLTSARLSLLLPTHGFVGLPDALKLPLEKVNDSQTGFHSEIQNLLDKLSYL